MIGLLIYLLVLCLVAGVVWYILNLLPIPQPFKQIILVVFLLILLLVILDMFLPLTGMSMGWHAPLLR